MCCICAERAYTYTGFSKGCWSQAVGKFGDIWRQKIKAVAKEFQNVDWRSWEPEETRGLGGGKGLEPRRLAWQNMGSKARANLPEVLLSRSTKTFKLLNLTVLSPHHTWSFSWLAKLIICRLDRLSGFQVPDFPALLATPWSFWLGPLPFPDFYTLEGPRTLHLFPTNIHFLGDIIQSHGFKK